MKSVAQCLGAAVALAAVAIAQTSDADVMSIAAQLNNVTSAITTLDADVSGYVSPANNAGLLTAAQNVISALNVGQNVVSTIPGNISINQAAIYLLTPLNKLNSATNATVTDAIDMKALLVSNCLGPSILSSLQTQLSAATSFRLAITSLFAAGSDQNLAENLSEPAITYLNYAIGNYSDETTLPASCLTSSASSSSLLLTTASSTTTPSSAPATVGAATSTSSAPLTSTTILPPRLTLMPLLPPIISGTAPFPISVGPARTGTGFGTGIANATLWTTYTTTVPCGTNAAGSTLYSTTTVTCPCPGPKCHPPPTAGAVPPSPVPPGPVAPPAMSTTGPSGPVNTGLGVKVGAGRYAAVAMAGLVVMAFA